MTDERSLVLDELDDRLAAFNAFRKSDGEKADAIDGDLGSVAERHRQPVGLIGAVFD